MSTINEEIISSSASTSKAVQKHHTESADLDDLKSNKVDEPINLESLIVKITDVLKKDKDIPLSKRVDIQHLMAQYDSSLGDWRRYALFDPAKNYTRNLVSTDDETYTLMVLCWNPEKESPIHDHPCSNGCYMRTLFGSLRETRYTMNEKTNSLEQIATSVAQSPDVVYIDDDQGFHKVGACSPNGAVSLHLYSPPFNCCRCWLNSDRADRVLRPIITYYSENGERIEYGTDDDE